MKRALFIACAGLVLGAAAAPRLAALAAGLFDVGRIEFLSGLWVAGLIVGGMAVGCLGGLVASRRMR